MRKFLLNALLFFLINAGLAGGYIFITQHLYAYRNADSESHLFVMPRRQQYGVVILGASHGRVFSSAGNHERVERALGKKILNLSKTAGGLLPEKAYLAYFYDRGNTAEQIVYVLDPFVFFGQRWNDKAFFLEDEPLQFDFFLVALRVGVSRQALINYARSKFTPFWVASRKPAVIDNDSQALQAVDRDAVAKRLDVLYPNGADQEAFDRYSPLLKEILELAREHRSKVTILFPSTLLGDVPGKTKVQNYLTTLKKDYNFSFFDFSGTMQEPKWFRDHDHLNSAGVEVFSRKYLRPAVVASTVVQ